MHTTLTDALFTLSGSLIHDTERRFFTHPFGSFFRALFNHSTGLWMLEWIYDMDKNFQTVWIEDRRKSFYWEMFSNLGGAEEFSLSAFKDAMEILSWRLATCDNDWERCRMPKELEREHFGNLPAFQLKDALDESQIIQF